MTGSHGAGDLEPAPGDVARLDQLSARWRDLPEPVRGRVEEAAARLREDPGPERVAVLLAELRAAGLAG
ncbi:hypothetical protein [Kitasatospora sp. NPDC087315]|uniref:hypothetical protein n=1 Tax=Kitasatospora sp. NPDC087315 TaxID=3364069 RepID=UPI0037F16667